MSFLVCAGCSRHIKGSEERCPFCGVAAAGAVPAGNPSLVGARARQRLLFGAASALSTAAVIAGCTTTPDTSYVFMYGAPNVDAGDTEEGGSGVPHYGLPAPEDGGGGNSTDAALYGGPIFDSGNPRDSGAGDAADASDGD